MPRKHQHHEDPLAEEVPFDEAEVEEDETDIDAVLQQAGEIAAEISRLANTDKAKARRKVRELEKLLAGVTIEQAAELAESPTIQKFARLIAPPNMQPGETRNAGTLAEVSQDWTWKDVYERFPMKQLMPMETLTITWNGLSWRIIAGEPCSLPEPFYDEYMHHVYAQRQAERHIRFMLDKNAPPPDPNWLTNGSQLVRATTQMGSGRMSVGPLTEEEA